MMGEIKEPGRRELNVIQGEHVLRGLRRAVRHALIEHKRAGNPVAVWEDGKVIIIPAEEIQVEEMPNETQPGRRSGGRNMTETVDVEEAKERLPELVSLALEGNEVIISEGDRPVARLVPF